MIQIKAIYQEQLDKDCQDPVRKYDMDDDHNNIMEIVTIKYAFKTLKLIATLMIVVFILSMLTLLLFDQADVIMGTDSAEWAHTDHFWADYEIADMSASRIMLVAIYYS